MAKNLPDFDSLWDYNHPADTERKFRELLTLAETSADKSYYLQLLTQLARTLSLQRKFDEANEVLNKVEPMLIDDLKLPKIRYLLERKDFEFLRLSGKSQAALPRSMGTWAAIGRR